MTAIKYSFAIGCMLTMLNGALCQNAESLKWEFSADISAGISRYYSSTSQDFDTYPTPEISGAFVAHRRIARSRFTLNFGLGYSRKVHRRIGGEWKTGSNPTAGTLFMQHLTDKRSLQYPFAINIPLSVGYTIGIRHTIEAGIMGRCWFAKDDEYSSRYGRPEYGATLAFYSRLTEKLSLGVTSYSGFHPFFSGSISTSSMNSYSYDIRNQYVLLSTRYLFTKR